MDISMNKVILNNGVEMPQMGYGVYQVSPAECEHCVSDALKVGYRMIDTAQAYHNEEGVGNAVQKSGIDRKEIFLVSKVWISNYGYEKAKTSIDESLRKLQTDYIDLFQFHNPAVLPDINDPDGPFAAALEAKQKGYIRHIGITNHRLKVAHEAIESGNFETLQFPFCYLATEKDLELVELCREHDMGFIAMKGLSGGLLNNAEACYAFMQEHPDVVPIWGIQHEWELDQWLELTERNPRMTPELQAVIDHDRKELAGDFCRSCGYCLPCPAGIQINQCARISLMIRRAPSESWLAPAMQDEMEKIEHCLGCGQCKSRCPYELDTPNLLKRNLADYRRILAGEVSTESYLRPAQK